MHLSLGNHGRSVEQQQELRESRRLLKESIRNDWDYPALPAYQDTQPTKKTASRDDRLEGLGTHAGAAQSSRDGGLTGDSVIWAEREYGSTDSEGEDGDGRSRTAQAQDDTPKRASGYRFEGPDSVGQDIASRKTARKRKREVALEGEISWNEGLRHWVARRDSWCGARTPAQVQLIQARRPEAGGLAPTSPSMGSSPRSSSSTRSDATAVSRPSTSTTSPDLAAMSLEEAAAPSPAGLLVPLMPPVLPNHPIRKKIGPGMYNEIYSKIILQSRTPSVPVNLSNLTNALVHGWKADGEWPPKNSAPEPSVRRKRASVGGLKEGVKAVTRALRIGGADHGG